MRQCTNITMIEQIYSIFQRISLGIIQAEEVLRKTEEINSSVEIQIGKADLIRSEITEITNQNQKIENNIQQLYTEIQNIHYNLIQEFSEKPNRENSHSLNPELNSIFTKLNQIQIKITQIEQGSINCNQPLTQECNVLHQLLSQIEEDKQAITDLTRNLENRMQRVIKLQTEVEQVLMMEDHLDTINSEISSLAIEVRNNREALHKIQSYLDNTRNNSDNSLWELRGELEHLRENLEHNYRDIKSKIQMQTKNQQRLDNWLFGITFGVAFLVVTWLLSH